MDDIEREEIRKRIDNEELFYNDNYPGGAWYDSETNTYYNRSGQRLRDIREYDKSSEGYTPFGDEGDDY